MSQNPQTRLELVADTKSAEAGLGRVGQALERLRGVASNASAGTASSVGAIDTSVKGLEGSVIKAGLALGVLRAGLSGLRDIAGAAVSANLDLERSQRVLNTATGDGAGAMNYIRKLAKDLGLELTGTAQGYSQVAAAAKNTKLEGEPAKQIFEAMAKALVGAGASSEGTSRGLLAVSQMMSKGKVSSEELRQQLGEHLPGAMGIAARAMNTNAQGLEKMIQAGLPAEEFLPRFAAEITKNLGDAPEAASRSLQASINRMKTSLQELALQAGQGGASDGLSAALTEITEKLSSADAIQGARSLGSGLGDALSAGVKLAGVIYQLRDGILALGVGWASLKIAAMIQALGAWTSAKIAVTSATLAGRTALVQEALAMAGVTVSTKASTAAQLQQALALTASRIAAVEDAMAKGFMAQADGRAQLASLALTRAKLAEAAAVTGASGAMGVASRAMALMGGPIGVAVLLLGGLVLMWSKVSRSAEEAAASVRKYHEADLKALGDWDEATGKLRELDATIKSGRLSRDEMAIAQARMAAELEKLTKLYPDLLRYLVDEKGQRRGIGEAIALANAARLKGLEMQVEEAEFAEKELESLVARRRQWVEYGKARIVASADGSWRESQLARKDTDWAERNLKADEDSRRMQKDIVRDLRERLTTLQKISAVSLASVRTGGTAGGTGKADKAVESTFEQELLKIAEQRLQVHDGMSEAERERVELQRVELDLGKELSALDARRTKEAWTGAQLETALGAAKEAAEVKAQAIRDKYAAARKAEAAEVKAIKAQAAGAHAEALMRLEDALLQHMYDAGVINQRQLADLMSQAEERRYTAASKELDAEIARHSKGTAAYAKAIADREKLDDQHNLRATQSAGQAQQADATGTFSGGAMQYVADSKRELTAWGTQARNIMQGVEGAFASGIAGILSGQMKLGEAMRSIWRGITSTVIQALAQMVAKWIVAGIASRIFKDTTVASANAAAVAQQGAAAAGIFAAHSYIPFVGPAIAAGLVMMMNAALIANAASAKGIVGAAHGGWFDQPTLTMIGEGQRPELVVPDTSFKDFAANLSANILAQERQAQSYSRMAAGYASGVPSPSAAGTGGGYGGGPVHNYMGATIVAVNSTEWENMVAAGSKGYAKRVG